MAAPISHNILHSLQENSDAQIRILTLNRAFAFKCREFKIFHTISINPNTIRSSDNCMGLPLLSKCKQWLDSAVLGILSRRLLQARIYFNF